MLAAACLAFGVVDPTIKKKKLLRQHDPYAGGKAVVVDDDAPSDCYGELAAARAALITHEMEAQLGVQILTDTVDFLITNAWTMLQADLDPPLAAWRIFSVASQRRITVTEGVVIQPLCHSAHFVLLAARMAG